MFRGEGRKLAPAPARRLTANRFGIDVARQDCDEEALPAYQSGGKRLLRAEV